MSLCKDYIHHEVCIGNDFKQTIYEHCKNDNVELLCNNFKDSLKHIDLPCNIGDKIFYFDTAGNIYCEKVQQFIINSVGILIDAGIMFNSKLLGERFFLSHEDAEKAIKECEKV